MHNNLAWFEVACTGWLPACGRGELPTLHADRDDPLDCMPRSLGAQSMQVKTRLQQPQNLSKDTNFFLFSQVGKRANFFLLKQIVIRSTVEGVALHSVT